MRPWALAFILLSEIACREAIDMVADKRTRDDLFFMSSFRVELEPAPSPHLKQGENVPIRLRAVLKSGEVCRHCEASWSSSAPEVAAFSEEPRCAGRSCVVLEGVSPGTATLSVVVCQAYDRDCVRRKFNVRVAR